MTLKRTLRSHLLVEIREKWSWDFNQLHGWFFLDLPFLWVSSLIGASERGARGAMVKLVFLLQVWWYRRVFVALQTFLWSWVFRLLCCFHGEAIGGVWLGQRNIREAAFKARVKGVGAVSIPKAFVIISPLDFW